MRSNNTGLSTMTKLYSFISFAAIVIPLLYLLWNISISQSPGKLKKAVILLIAAIAMFICLRPHEDIYTGLDNSAYRLMAEAFDSGRNLTGTDTVAATIPEKLRLYFRYKHTGEHHLRPTRDQIFQTGVAASDISTTPFFMPFLPLAASVISAKYFPVLIGVLWFLLLAVSAIRINGKYGLATAAALTFATPWPFWFSRGFFPDAAGAFIASSVLIHAATCKRQNTVSALCSGLLLGISVSTHPTSALVAAVIFIYIIISDTRLKIWGLTILSLIIGIFPFWAITRYICHPYGDWTRLSCLIQTLKFTPEHRTLMAGIILLAVLGIAVICTMQIEKLRNRIADFLRKTPSGIWFIIAALPAFALTVLHTPMQETLRKELFAVWHGILIPGAIIWLTASYFLLNNKNRLPEKLLFVMTVWLFIPFLLIKSAEVPVGIWSMRRAAPPVILLTSLFASAVYTGRNTKKRFSPKFIILLCLAVGISLINVCRWPLAYFGINDRGAVKLQHDIRSLINDRDLVLFDYYTHFVPVGADLTHRTLGLGAHAVAHWPEIEKWIAEEAVTSKVALVSTWLPTSLEEDFCLEPIHEENSSSASADLQRIVSKTFLPAAIIPHHIENHVMSVIPFSDIGTRTPVQKKKFTGSPFGIRGNWFYPRGKDFAWSQQDCGIVGPVHTGEIKFNIETGWYPPNDTIPMQTMLITPPWTTNTVSFTVSHGMTNLTVSIPGPSTVHDNIRAGVYKFSSPSPYDPAKYGIKGYPNDLGVVIRAVEIE